MNQPAVNLGAGGFVSYYENGGAAVPPSPYRAPEEPVDAERGIGAYIADTFYRAPPSEGEEATPIPYFGSSQTAIRKSGRTGTENRETYYPEGPTFFETIAEKYGYPTERMQKGVWGINLDGKTRHTRPPQRQDMPTAQELEDVRAHMLGAAFVSKEYGPGTAETMGNIAEVVQNPLTLFKDSPHSIMDKRNNAVGISLFNQAGIKATPAQLTAMVDKRIFEQLNIILGRKPEERGSPADRPQWKHNFRSPPTGPDVYFPRGNSGHFLSD